jgi:tetratricopeptide (TPR) repeat protein
MILTTLLVPTLLSMAPAPAGSATVQVVQDRHAHDLITRGRALLDAGKLAAALELFEQADAERAGALSTRMWVLRVWFAQGRINDAFNQTDVLAEDNSGPDLDYLYGMGSFLKAKKYMAENVPSNTTGFALQDAQIFLAKALAADGDKYYDAWLPLAEAAWLNQDPESAEKAAAEAVQRNPGPLAGFLQARILFSRYQVLSADEKTAEQASETLTRSIAAFRSAIAGVQPKPEEAARLADMYVNLGLALQWAADGPGAEEAYAETLGWNPNAFAFGTYWDSLGPQAFTRVLLDGAARFTERWGDKTTSDATLLWWLGYAQFSSGSHAEAETNFRSAVEKWPAYMNSYFYIGMSRYHRADYEGAVQAWREHWIRKPSDLVAMVNSNLELYPNVLAYTQGKCAEQGQPPLGRKPALNLDAAFLGEVLCAADGSRWKSWNDLGLFSRDGGNYLRVRDKKGDASEAQRLFERALEAYDRALELAPGRAHLYNDKAVVLHYYLERDYPKAMELYEKAHAMAVAQLKTGELDEGTQSRVETAKRDSAINIRKLKRKLEQEKGDGDGDGTPQAA